MTRWQGASFRAGTSHLSELTLAEIVCENDPSICLDLLRSVLESNYQYPAVVVRLQDFFCAVKTSCEKNKKHMYSESELSSCFIVRYSKVVEAKCD